MGKKKSFLCFKKCTETRSLPPFGLLPVVRCSRRIYVLREMLSTLLDFWTLTPANTVSDFAYFPFSFRTWPQNANECKQWRRGGLEGTFLRQHTIPGWEGMGGVRTVKVSRFRSVLGSVSGVSDHLRPPVTPVIRRSHVSRPIRVSLADRNECRTNTTGFGPEWRSNTWRRKASRKDW